MQSHKVFKLLSIAAVLFLFILVFNFWLTPRLMFGGDFFFPPFFNQLEKLSPIPFAWDMQKGAGLGGRSLTTMWIDSYTQTLPNVLMQLGLPAWIVQKLVFQIPLLAISIFSSLYLFRLIFPEYHRIAMLVPVIFSLNTYFLMVVAGGQTGVALGYAVAPAVLGSFIKLINSIKKLRITNYELRMVFISGLLLAFQVWVDLRLAYITMMVAGLYAVFILMPLLAQKQEIKEGIVWRLRIVFFVAVIPLIVVGLLHAFWILPIVIFRANPVTQFSPAYTTTGAVSYFSFANFSHALSLLHSNWPENIFGKTYFLQPEFLILPILAFTSLLFINRNQKSGIRNQETGRYVLFFALLGLVGAFLAKGANEPLGIVYFWLFDHLPGFIMFRDSTKFYLLGAISYSTLIPFTIGESSEWLYRKGMNYKVSSSRGFGNHNTLFLIPYIVFLLIWAFTIRPAVNGQIGGLLKPKVIDREYGALKNLLLSEKLFIRTFVIPARQRYVYFSTDYPSIDSASLLEESSIPAILVWLKGSTAQEQLSRWAVKYVVVPTDPDSEIFQTERKYDNRMREETIRELRTISWLTEKSSLEPLAVFEVPNPMEHFWIESDSNKYSLEKTRGKQVTSIKYQAVNPTKYLIQLDNQTHNAMLVFSEAYDQYWVLAAGAMKVHSVRTPDGLNSFPIPTSFTQAIVEYEQQNYVRYGLMISAGTLAVVLLCLIIVGRRRTR